MSYHLWRTDPDRYSKCSRCEGTGSVNCRPCSGKGTTAGPHRSHVGLRVSRRWARKECPSCRGSGKQRCGFCKEGSVRKESSVAIEDFPSSANLLESVVQSRQEPINPLSPEPTVFGPVSSLTTQASLEQSLRRKPLTTVKGSRSGHLVGRVNYYFDFTSVAEIDLVNTIQLGDTIRISGLITDFAEKVESIQLNGSPVTHADSNSQIRLKVSQPVRVGDQVYKVSPQADSDGPSVENQGKQTTDSI